MPSETPSTLPASAFHIVERDDVPGWPHPSTWTVPGERWSDLEESRSPTSDAGSGSGSDADGEDDETRTAPNPPS